MRNDASKISEIPVRYFSPINSIFWVGIRWSVESGYVTLNANFLSSCVHNGIHHCVNGEFNSGVTSKMARHFSVPCRYVPCLAAKVQEKKTEDQYGASILRQCKVESVFL